MNSVDRARNGDVHGADFDIAMNGCRRGGVPGINPGRGGTHRSLGEVGKQLSGGIGAGTVIICYSENQVVLCPTHFTLHEKIILCARDTTPAHLRGT